MRLADTMPAGQEGDTSLVIAALEGLLSELKQGGKQATRQA